MPKPTTTRIRIGSSDGLTEVLIAKLSRPTWMSVVSRINSIRYKGSKLYNEAIGHEPGARYTIEGAVRRHALFRQTKANIENATPSDIELIRKDLTCVALMQGEVTARTSAFLHRNKLGAGVLDQPQTSHLLYVTCRTANWVGSDQATRWPGSH